MVCITNMLTLLYSENVFSGYKCMICVMWLLLDV